MTDNIAKFNILYRRARSLNMINSYAQMEAKVMTALNELEEELNEKQAEIERQVAFQEETGRCATCRRALLECICD